MSPTEDRELGALLSGLTGALALRDADVFAGLWPAAACDYAHGFYERLLKDFPAGFPPGDVNVVTSGDDCGILRPAGVKAGAADIGYCRVNGRLKLVWKYAAARRKIIAGWAAQRTKYYLVRLSPGLASAPDLSAFDPATERIAAYFSLKPPKAVGEFVLLSRRNELVGAVPPLLNRCDYLDPVTADIVSVVPADRHEITHRVLLLNGFPCRALALMQEGAAEIFNPSPYAPESALTLTPALVCGLLEDAGFYSDKRNFSRAAKFCNGVIQLLGMEAFRKLYPASGSSLAPMLESISGCGLEEFLARVMERTRLPAGI